MHRSGTSALTRVLSLCGAALPKTLMPAGPANKSGHWEPARIVEVHDEFLARVGSSWSDVAPVPAPASVVTEASAELRDRLRTLVADEYGETSLFVVKDPRLSRLLPLWRSVLAELQIDLRCVISVREPWEVARSLEARDSMDVRRSLIFWLRDMLAAERESRGLPRAFVSYDGLLNDWRAAVQGISEQSGVCFPSAFDEAAIDAFLSRSERHHQVDPAADLEKLPLLVQRARREFLKAAGGEVRDTVLLDEISETIEVASALFGPLLIDAERTAASARHSAAETKAELQRLHLDTESKIVGLQSLLGQTTTDLARTQSDLARTSEDLSRQQLESARLRGELDAAITHAEDIRIALETATREAADLQASLSHRLTAPVRGIAARFPGAARNVRSAMLVVLGRYDRR